MYGKLKGYELFNRRVRLEFEKGIKILLIQESGVIEVHSSLVQECEVKLDQINILLQRERDCLVVSTTMLNVMIYNNFILNVYDKQTDELLYETFKGKLITC